MQLTDSSTVLPAFWDPRSPAGVGSALSARPHNNPPGTYPDNPVWELRAINGYGNAIGNFWGASNNKYSFYIPDLTDPNATYFAAGNFPQLPSDGTIRPHAYGLTDSRWISFSLSSALSATPYLHKLSGPFMRIDTTRFGESYIPYALNIVRETVSTRRSLINQEFMQAFNFNDANRDNTFHVSELAGLAPLFSFPRASARDVNNFGQAVGTSERKHLTFAYPVGCATLWEDNNFDGKREMWSLDRRTACIAPPTSGGSYANSGGESSLPLVTEATSINAKGDVVGNRIQPMVLSDASRPVIFEHDGRVIDLNDYLPADSGWVLESAAAINNRRQVVGVGRKLVSQGDTIRRGYLLQLPPAPVFGDVDSVLFDGKPDGEVNISDRDSPRWSNGTCLNVIQIPDGCRNMDLNRDNKVTLADRNIIANYLLMPNGAPRNLGDINGNGQVDQNDKAAISSCHKGLRRPIQIVDGWNCYMADLNRNGSIDLQDIKQFAFKYPQFYQHHGNMDNSPDGSVSEQDKQAFYNCFSGPGKPILPQCLNADLNLDGRVDHRDTALFGTKGSRTFAASGDMNCDCLVDGSDIQGFTHAISNITDYMLTYPDCDYLNGDFDADGQITAYDQIQFVNHLSQGDLGSPCMAWIEP